MNTVNKTIEEYGIHHIKINLAVIRENNIDETAEYICEDLFKTAVILLENSFFKRAEEFFYECLKVVPNDEKSTLGVFCSKVCDKELFTSVYNESYNSRVLPSSGKPIVFINEFENAIIHMCNTTALENLLKYVIFNGISESSIKWEGFDTEHFELLLKHCLSEKYQTKLIKEYLNACVKAGKEKSSNDICELFSHILQYFPPIEKYATVKYLDSFSKISIEKGDFDKAKEYAFISLKKSPEFNIEARYTLLLASLKCKTETDILNCDAFDINMPEYKKLLEACEDNAELFKKYEEFRYKFEEKQLKIKKELEAQKEYDLRCKEQNELLKINIVTISLAVIIATLICFAVTLIMRFFDPKVSSVVLFFAIFVVLMVITICTIKTKYETNYEIVHITALFIDAVVPAVFSFINWYLNGNTFIGILSLILAMGFAIFVGAFDYYDEEYRMVILSLTPIPLAIAALTDFFNGGGVAWRGIICFIISLLSSIFVLWLSHKRVEDGYLDTNLTAIIAAAFNFLIFAILAIAAFIWGGWYILLGILFSVAAFFITTIFMVFANT